MPHQPLGAVGVGEDPGPELLLDELLLLPGGERRLLVDDALVAVAGLDRGRRSPAFSCSGPARAARCRWPAPCRSRRSRPPTARRCSRPRRSRPRLSSGGRCGWPRAGRRTGRRRTPGCRAAGIHGAPRLASMSPGSTSSGWTAAGPRRCGHSPARPSRPRRAWPGRCPRDRRRPSARSCVSGSWKIRSPSSAMICVLGLAVERGDEGQIDRAAWFEGDEQPFLGAGDAGDGRGAAHHVLDA